MAKASTNRYVILGLLVVIVIVLIQVENRGLGRAAGGCTADAECTGGQLCIESACTAVVSTGCVLPGDASGNGALDCADVGCITALILGNSQNGCNPGCADLAPVGAQDGKITVADAIAANRLIPNCYQ